MEQQDWAFTSIKEIMPRAINVEGKTGLKSNIMVWNIISHCSRGHYPSQNTATKVQTQALTAKEFKPEEFRPKDLKLANRKISASLRTNEPEKISHQD